jgi:4,5-dihydroxyphthalate decarboxylase
MARLALTLACGDYDRTLALRTGAVRPDGVDLHVLPLEPKEMFFRMARHRDFDVAKFSLATYTVLRGRGEPLVAIPVFPPFAFRRSAIFVREGAGIREPRDIAGKRVGVPKYHMTAAVWIRGILEDDYGVAPADMQWVEGGRARRSRRWT